MVQSLGATGKPDQKLSALSTHGKEHGKTMQPLSPTGFLLSAWQEGEIP